VETGQSLTRVVVESLRERHAKIEKRNGKASLAELMAIAKRASRAVKRPYVEHGRMLPGRQRRFCEPPPSWLSP
jgi:antitoxin VapB